MAWQSILYFLFWAALFAVMMRFGCGAHVMGHRSRHDTSNGGADNPESAVDPVCGKTVRITEAKSAVYQRQPYFFCSPACRERFEARPTAFAHAPSHQEHHHGC